MPRPYASHIQEIYIVSNTHWDREFRKSFERTRRGLLDMLDVTIDILERDPAYHSFTLDAHTILLEDYLEMRPERRETVGRLLRDGRLIIGPWHTLPEVISIGDEALVRNFLQAKKVAESFGVRPMPVGYTPASWGQTGQLPQIMAGFGVSHLMFYRGISHHESDAEFIWEASDGTRTLASRFALYARYNWYYQVHRMVTRGTAFDKVYDWAAHDETPMRVADGLAGPDTNFRLLEPSLDYDRGRLAEAMEAMVAAEGPHFTTPIFLAMHGHDISVAHPRESEIVRDANDVQSKWKVVHANLMEYWKRVEETIERDKLPVLVGERRSPLVKGMWTYLLPATVSARTYQKIMDFETHHKLVARAEPLATLAAALGAEYPRAYLDRGWRWLLTNHTHDANGGCAPDRVIDDMMYRYRQAQDCADIVCEDAMAHIAKNLDPGPADGPAWRLLVFNPLPAARRALLDVELEIPASDKAKSLIIRDTKGRVRPYQIVDAGPSGAFIDSIWDVPCISNTTRFRVLVDIEDVPSVGYEALTVEPSTKTDRRLGSLVVGPMTLENDFVRLRIASDGAADLVHKETSAEYRGLNSFRDQGEVGTAWFHTAPTHDEILSTAGGAAAQVAVIEDGPLQASIRALVPILLPAECPDETRRSQTRIPHMIETTYTIRRHDPVVSIRTTLDNRAMDHWLRAIFPVGLRTDHSRADSHFDAVKRPIALPDSSEWVEQAVGTHPLRTMVDLSDGRRGLSVFTRGLFEYEVLRETGNPLAISLLRGCRIKLLVSEERKQELPDTGIQCLGRQEFHYAVYAHSGDYAAARSLAQARRWATPLRAAQVGRGHGKLPWRESFFAIDRDDVIVTAVKRAESGDGAIVRLYNPVRDARTATLIWHKPIAAARLLRLDETPLEDLKPDGPRLAVPVGPKKIVTVLVETAK